MTALIRERTIFFFIQCHEDEAVSITREDNWNTE